MRDRIERLAAVFPFSLGCASESSVDIANNEPTKPKREIRTQEREKNSPTEKVKSSWVLLAIPKLNLGDGICKLVKSLKTFAQLLVYKEEKEDMEKEIEIGFPTNVKHVTHIGWDGTTTTNPVKGWENLTPPELLSFPSISRKQFELAMTAQATNQPPNS